MVNSRKDDDLDSILSSIMHGENSTDAPKQKLNKKKQQPKANKSSRAGNRTDKPKADKPRSFAFGTVAKYYFRKLRHNKFIKYFAILIITLVVITGIVIAVPQIMDSVLAPSPFNDKIRQDAEYSLYYPKKLPEDFKIETNSISEADDGVIIYAISDYSGRRITVTTQKKPKDLDLETIYATLNDIYEVDTPLGVVKVGTSASNVLIANVLTEDSWMLVNTPNGNVSKDQLNQVLQNLKRG